MADKRRHLHFCFRVRQGITLFDGCLFFGHAALASRPLSLEQTGSMQTPPTFKMSTASIKHAQPDFFMLGNAALQAWLSEFRLALITMTTTLPVLVWIIRPLNATVHAVPSRTIFPNSEPQAV